MPPEVQSTAPFDFISKRPRLSKAVDVLMPTASMPIEDTVPEVRAALAWVLCRLLRRWIYLMHDS